MSQRKTTFGLTLSNRAVVTRGTQPKDLIDMAVRAEASGRVHAVWVGDSILSKPRLECIPLLGAIAGHTSRLRLGVACMATIAQRNPVLLALQWSSLDVLSGGRTWLAACMGYPASQHPTAAKELEVMGIASKERPGRLEEMIQALRPSGQMNTPVSTGNTIHLMTWICFPNPFNSRAPSISRVPRGQLASVSVELSAPYGGLRVMRTVG